MSEPLAKAESLPQIMERVLLAGDLSRLSPEERVRYYAETCASLGLNPLTRPLEYITLNGRLTLYARRDAADQLRRLHGISLEIVSREIVGDLYVVHVRARARDGSTDEEIGAVSTAGLRGDALANALLKAITKAKRRVTLSICGLGMLDETEVETIPGTRPAPEPLTAEPPEAAEPADAAPGRPGTPAQLRRYMALRRELGLSAARDAILDELSARLGRTITSREDVTFDEWEMINAALAAQLADHRQAEAGAETGR